MTNNDMLQMLLRIFEQPAQQAKPQLQPVYQELSMLDVKINPPKES